MKHIAAASVGMLMAAAIGAARADTVTDWNQTAIEVMKAARIGGNPWSRTLAMVHVAMSDAINSVQNRYARIVRVWGGIYFRHSLDVGYDMGKKIAAYLVDNSLTPAR